MEILGFFVPGVLIGIALTVAASVLADRASAGEEEKNNRFPTPPWHQIAWHILHSRQDIRLTNLLLGAILMTLWIKL